MIDCGWFWAQVAQAGLLEEWLVFEAASMEPDRGTTITRVDPVERYACGFLIVAGHVGRELWGWAGDDQIAACGPYLWDTQQRYVWHVQELGVEECDRMNEAFLETLG